MRDRPTKQIRHAVQVSRPATEAGVVLLAAIFALLILSLMGLSLLNNASTEVLINDNFKRSRAAYFAAEAATEEARFRLSPTAGANRIDTLFSDLTASTTVVYIRRDATINPTNSVSTNPFYDPEYNTIKVRASDGTLTTSTSTLSGQTPTYRASMITSNIPFAWVKVTRKTELLAGQNVDAVNNQSTPVHFGPLTATGVVSQYVRDAANSLTHDPLKSNPVYLVTAMALDNTGAQRKILTEITTPPPLNTEAAINSYHNVDFIGDLSISGIDECNPLNKVYGVSSHGTIDSLNPTQTVVGQDPPPPASPGDPSLCPGCPFNYDVPQLINWLKDNGPFQPINTTGTNVTCSTGSAVSCTGSNAILGTPPNVPPPATPTNTPELKYYYSPGNLTLTSTNTQGYGILVVDGDVTFNGGVYFEGIIIAKGSFNFTGNGGDEINIRGAIVAGQGITDTTSDLGGSIEVQYNSCSIANAFMNMPMAVVTFKDRALY
jgi:hypothetical protein